MNELKKVKYSEERLTFEEANKKYPTCGYGLELFPGAVWHEEYQRLIDNKQEELEKQKKKKNCKCYMDHKYSHGKICDKCLEIDDKIRSIDINLRFIENDMNRFLDEYCKMWDVMTDYGVKIYNPYYFYAESYGKYISSESCSKTIHLEFVIHNLKEIKKIITNFPISRFIEDYSRYLTSIKNGSKNRALEEYKL